MPQSSFSLSPRPQPRFLNREEQLGVGVTEISELRRDPAYFKVLEVNGHGGMGKTRLLKQMREIAIGGSPPDHVLWVSLEADAHATELGPLLLIRDQLTFECLLFDTALVTFWRATGQRLHLELSSQLAHSLPVQALQTLGSIAGTQAPIAFALEAFNFAKRKKTMLERYRQQEFESIDELWEVPGEIRRFLPNYLGCDIARALGPADELVAFYDGYEKQRAETLLNSDPWLRELVGTLRRGIHVISTRESLQWKAFDDGNVEGVDVGKLPEAQSRELIQTRLGNVGRPIEDRLLEASHQIPFFLDAIISSCEHRAPSDSLDLNTLPSSPEDSVSYLLEHLSDTQQKLAVALATIQVFDRYVFECVVRELNLQVDLLGFDQFTEQFFVEEVAFGLHKTHDLLTDFVRKSQAVLQTREAALEAISDDLPLRCHDTELAKPHALLAVLGAAVSGWYSVDAPATGSVEALIDVGYILYDAGYWNEVGALPSQGAPADHPVAVAVKFFAALAARRSSGVNHAQELFEALKGQFPVLGRHARSAELEVAYLTELAGDYRQAREEFRKLEERVGRFDPTNRVSLRLRLYHADMLIMDGQLREGSRILLEAYEADGLSKVDWIELVRHRGHAFRFSFLLETAESLYLQAMQAAEEIGSLPLQGKLWTNLAETYCWHDPHRALEAASRSIELNSRFGNRIELAKCNAAKGIAFAKLGEFTPATEAIDEARLQSEQVGYPAGVAFSQQASSVLHGLRADADQLMSAMTDFDQALAELGTYAHLRVAPTWLARSEIEFAKASAAFDWLEPADLEARLRSCLTT